MRRWLFTLLICLANIPCRSENYLLNGGLESRIAYRMVQEIKPSLGTRMLVVSYVIPQSFNSPSYRQRIDSFEVHFSEPPYRTETVTDRRGNHVNKAYWIRPYETIEATIHIEAYNQTRLAPLRTDAPFPVALDRLSEEAKGYLSGSRQVPSDHHQIKRLADLLTVGSETQFDAVQKILTYIVDHVSYALRPERYDALYAIETGRGNCQNYSHLAAALMRAVNIPVRIVNGVTLREKYSMKIRGGTITMRMGQGRHSWIEVFFDDLGWVPFDPQQMQMFVSNRFIRVEVGLDNQETVNDGTIRWAQFKGTSGRPALREMIEAKFISDRIDIVAERQSYGPRNMLFSPPVEAAYRETILHRSEAAGPSVTRSDLQSYRYDIPVEFGNLEFPKDIDFLESQGDVLEDEDGTMVMTKDFLVETSEYVTTKGQKYAQIFLVDTPLLLQRVGLALHKFGGQGQLWVEILEDDDGNPSNIVTTSRLLALEDIPFTPGYRWVDFDITKEKTLIGPGRYWISLAYSGSPIINWFFTYGKPVGPANGTRFQTVLDASWSHHLVYEFNYRIVGLTGKR